MIDAQTQAILQALLRRDSLSLLRYLRDAYPWHTLEGRDTVARLRQLADEDEAGTGELVEFLRLHKSLPTYVGSFPTSFTTLNFVGADYLLKLLVKDQQKALADAERDLAALTDAGAKEQVQRLLDRKRRHLEELQKLASAVPAQPAAG
jgi:hypothetical protein